MLFLDGMMVFYHINSASGMAKAIRESVALERVAAKNSRVRGASA